MSKLLFAYTEHTPIGQPMPAYVSADMLASGGLEIQARDRDGNHVKVELPPEQARRLMESLLVNY